MKVTGLVTATQIENDTYVFRKKEFYAFDFWTVHRNPKYTIDNAGRIPEHDEIKYELDARNVEQIKI